MLSRIAAPMVGQSDLPFRTLVQRYGATLAYTQMLRPDLILNNQEYLEFHLRDLTMNPSSSERPVVVQLCGNDPDTVVQAGRKLQTYCQGIDLNLGCPQKAAMDGHFGAYLLGQKDWPLVEEIVAAMSNSFIVPTATKLRLCQPASKTLELAQRLESCGTSWVTLHARTVAPNRRRHGAADLSQVKRLKDNLNIPVVSNGNVRVWNDLEENLKTTGADGTFHSTLAGFQTADPHLISGLMIAETLLGNPCLFANKVPDPVDISLEYLAICRDYPGTASFLMITTHIRHFVDFQCHRRPWYHKFRSALNACTTLDDLERLLRVKVERWRGRVPRPMDEDDSDDEDLLSLYDPGATKTEMKVEAPLVAPEAVPREPGANAILFLLSASFLFVLLILAVSHPLLFIVYQLFPHRYYFLAFGLPTNANRLVVRELDAPRLPHGLMVFNFPVPFLAFSIPSYWIQSFFSTPNDPDKLEDTESYDDA
ncbi:FMN-linked oxidoreductase [Mycena sanguinolenta]|uniref:tRNA-dihydrouridine(16/17) synthase [NAD(P)(+)] n=1 Tax=Mycena sanguinolenta TaxID=230812 RepID=A0A8H7CQD6_9AGAR|nr:FMN-linked oxidoreductase [Mycena sanguinolenta]